MSIDKHSPSLSSTSRMATFGEFVSSHLNLSAQDDRIVSISNPADRRASSTSNAISASSSNSKIETESYMMLAPVGSEAPPPSTDAHNSTVLQHPRSSLSPQSTHFDVWSAIVLKWVVAGEPTRSSGRNGKVGSLLAEAATWIVSTAVQSTADSQPKSSGSQPLPKENCEARPKPVRQRLARLRRRQRPRRPSPASRQFDCHQPLHFKPCIGDAKDDYHDGGKNCPALQCGSHVFRFGALLIIIIIHSKVSRCSYRLRTKPRGLRQPVLVTRNDQTQLSRFREPQAI
jgi:hypothetical protein